MILCIDIEKGNDIDDASAYEKSVDIDVKNHNSKSTISIVSDPSISKSNSSSELLIKKRKYPGKYIFFLN